MAYKHKHKHKRATMGIGLRPVPASYTTVHRNCFLSVHLSLMFLYGPRRLNKLIELNNKNATQDLEASCKAAAR